MIMTNAIFSYNFYVLKKKVFELICNNMLHKYMDKYEICVINLVENY